MTKLPADSALLCDRYPAGRIRLARTDLKTGDMLLSGPLPTKEPLARTRPDESPSVVFKHYQIFAVQSDAHCCANRAVELFQRRHQQRLIIVQA